MSQNPAARFVRIDYGKKNFHIHYDGKWPVGTIVGGLHHFDYMHGKEIIWDNYDGDYLCLKDLLESIHNCCELPKGSQCIMQYLENGFLYEIEEEKELMKFWTDSDQDVPGEVHMFISYSEVLNTLEPHYENSEVFEPQTQSQQELPVNRDWEGLGDDFWLDNFTVETEDQSSQQAIQVSQVSVDQPSQQAIQVSSGQPIEQPTMQPSEQTTHQPSGQPSEQPAMQPTHQPSEQPTMQPSVQPCQRGRKYVSPKKPVSKKTASKPTELHDLPLEDEEHDTLEDLLADEELDVLPESTNLLHHDINDLPVEDDYHSGNSTCSENEADVAGEEPDIDLEGDEDVVEEEAQPDRYNEFQSDHQKYDDMYADGECEEEKVWTSATDEVEVGMTWPNMKEYKIWLTKYCIANGFEVKKKTDDPLRLRCQCRDLKCPFRLYAQKQGRNDGFTIKVTRFVNKHTCANLTGSGKNRMTDSDWVANVIEADIREDEHFLKPRKLINRLQVRHGVTVSYWVCWKGKGKALARLFGSYEDGYMWCPEVLNQIMDKNGNWKTIGLVTTYMDKDFSYCCLAFDAFLQGFIDGCRPFIGLDGCFLMGKYGGVMLSMVALDGNNGMYPLAIFICSSENKENWMLFLNLLKDRISAHPAPLTFISDGQKGLIPALETVLPSNRHRFCFRHMYENFKTSHRGVHMKTLAWGAAKAFRNHDHNRYMSLNSWMLDVRPKPIHRLLEGFNLKCMSLCFDRKMIVKKWESDGLILVHRADRILKNRVDKKKRYILYGASEFCWVVQHHQNGNMWEVDVKEKTCSCCVWEITGIPCVHVVAVACRLHMDLNSLVHEYHKVSAYKKAHGGVIRACASQESWVLPQMEVNPPKHKFKAGRPREKRIRSDVEMQESSKKAKRSCSHCGNGGHNIKRCPTRYTTPPIDRGRGRGRGRGSGRGNASTSSAPPQGRGRGSIAVPPPQGKGSGAPAVPPPQGRARGSTAAPPPPGRARGYTSTTPPPQGRARGYTAPPPPTQGRGRGMEYLLFGSTSSTSTASRGRSTPMSAARSATIGNFQHLYGSQPHGMREPIRPASQTFRPPRPSWRP